MPDASPPDAEQLQLQETAADFAAECSDLHAVLLDADTALWTETSTFKQWTVWDVIAHLHFSDHMALTSMRSADEFRSLLDSMRKHGAKRITSTWLRGDIGRDPTGPELLSRWHDTWQQLAHTLAHADPQQRYVWAGPGMRARMFATARQMETWAHGWEIFDLTDTPRQHHGRLINIATIGVKTFGWTFANRGLEVPPERPKVSLTGPHGEAWHWPTEKTDKMSQNVAQTGIDEVSGSAVEFCQVVTQVRHIDDTSLVVQGDTASAWMAIAQCFAGPPEEPPLPGSRGRGATPGVVR